ncbi:MAG: NADH-quinone oxidoreductase subunit L [Eubacterium sp.]|nr:NADH-quinone oxidoreductase subunit L [Eubacterium sp.]
MQVVPFLICFPMVIALLMFIIRADKVRNVIAYLGAVITMALVGLLVVQWIQGGCAAMDLYVETEIVDHIILVGDLIVMVVILIYCIKYRRFLISLLSIVPTIIVAYVELAGPKMTPMAHIHVDHLSILMCLIVAVVGGLIIIYSMGYMKGYHEHHKEVQDRRHYFFMVEFLFTGAMMGFVMTDSLFWLILFWEITSLSSFLLISYTRTEEAMTNAFRALWMNLVGGVALSIGVVLMAMATAYPSLQGLIWMGQMDGGQSVITLTIAFMAFAALTKSAQMPFSTWLMGAMVAPTPSSALLHSATMVKAGIYILFRLAPAMSGTATGHMIAIIGGFTFFTASVMAISQTDAKKVLALSTISNLGLMVACAGVGQPEAIWAGIFLMIFHAVSKSLLFLDVGATENSTHSRDIESFHGLLYRAPKLAIYMFIGIVGMFLAPFGMLISKWAALRAVIDGNNLLLIIFIVFGSATTAFYWTKWLGKLISQPYRDADVSKKINDVTKGDENISIGIHAVLMVALCVLFPVLSIFFVDPLLVEQFGQATQALPTGLLYILIFTVCLVFLVPFIARSAGKNTDKSMKMSYMNGINTGTNTEFVDALGNPKQLELANSYFVNAAGLKRWMAPCQMIALVVLIVMMSIVLGGVV